MVQVIDVSTWEEFEEKLKDIRLTHTSRFFPLLFRGHSDSRWALDTTLERINHKGMRFDEYYRIISSMRSEVETFTGTNWLIPTYPEVMALVQEYDTFSKELSFGRNPAYDYMAYLRHHGFPSPLLDWTGSPYIAAYFAFSKAENSENISIFVLSEADFHSGSNAVPKIYRFGPTMKVHRRHVLQQSQYTMCLGFNYGKEWRFC
jgi:FRG domain